MIDNNSKSGTAVNILIALILTALFYTGAILLYDFTYGVVDDWFISTVLNGAYTGTPDAHVVYIKYPLAWILTLLFTKIPQINWHFFLLAGCFAVCIFAVNFRICSNIKKLLNKIILSVLFMLLFWLCMGKMVLTNHYSMCAAVLAATGIFYAATIKKNSSVLNRVLNYAAVLFMLWVAYAIRARTLFMLLPLAGVVFIYKLFENKPVFRLKNLVRWLILPVILFVGLGAIELAHNAQYKSQEWQTFLSFNDARTTLYDFYGLPDYEKNKEFYESLNISEAREYIYEKYYLEFQDGVPEDALPEIADYRVEEAAQTMPTGKRIIESLKALPMHLTKKTYAPVNWICAASFIIILLIALIARKWRTVCALLLGIVASLIPWIWMIYMGKPTSRVTMGIWAADLLFLAALLIDNSEEIRGWLERKTTQAAKKTGAILRVCAAIVCAGGLLVAIGLGYGKLCANMEKALQSGQLRSTLEKWCEKNPDSLYISESELINGIGYDWKAVDNDLLNLYWPGGWSAKMAQSKEIWSRYGIEDIEQGIIENDHVFIVAFKDTDMSYWTEFYRENYPDAELVKTEDLDINGTQFTVYQLRER